MGLLSSDVYEVQNPALGAVMQWRFCVGYQAKRRDAAGPPLHLLFLVAPIVLHDDTLSVLRSTQRTSGLRIFAEKFTKAKVNQSDILLTVQRRTQGFRDLSLRSMQLAVAVGLITTRLNAEAVALSTSEPQVASSEATVLVKQSEKLGSWLAELTLREIAFTLKVRF